MASRVLGLVRDHFLANFFGTGPIAAAWEIAFMLPNMLRNLLAEGVLSQAFIPVYGQGLKESEEEAARVAGVVIAFIFCVLLILVATGVVLFPFVLPNIFATTEILLLVQLSQLMFVFIMTASLTALLVGISNAHHVFVFPAISPILLNLAFIGAFLILDPLELAAADNARVLAVVVACTGFLQLFVQAVYVWRKGWWPRLALRLRDPVLLQIFSLMAPAVLGAGLFQFNQLIDVAIASNLIAEELGAVPALRFAHRLIQLPTGIIGVALSTVILPTLVAHIKTDGGDSGENGRELMRALGFALFLTVPAGLGLFFLGREIINLLLYGGAWDAGSTDATMLALAFYAPGVPFYSLNKILTSSFYAYQDTRTPVKIMMGVLVVNITLNLTLVLFVFENQSGLALSTALCQALTSGLLLYFLRGKMGALPFDILIASLRKQVPLWIGMGLFLALIAWGPTLPAADIVRAVFGELADPTRAIALVYVLVGVGGGGAMYLGLSLFTGVREMDVFRRFLGRRGAGD